jgi:hypothetical protein
MNLQIAKDKRLLSYFVKIGDSKKALLVKDRIKTIEEELAES